jgi:hypothetical protein
MSCNRAQNFRKRRSKGCGASNQHLLSHPTNCTLLPSTEPCSRRMEMLNVKCIMLLLLFVCLFVFCHHHGWHHCCLFICSLLVHIIVQITNYKMKIEYRESFGYRRQNHCRRWEVHRKWLPCFLVLHIAYFIPLIFRHAFAVALNLENSLVTT